jgi:chemotaxis protein methyltransferase CheR
VRPISADELALWSAYVKKISGIVLDETKGYLIETRLSDLARETAVETWHDLYVRTQNDPAGQLRRKVVDAITTGETSFFRDASPFEMVQYKIVPELIDARRKSLAPGSTVPIRIWSAACSTGQEVYTLAMVMRELIGAMKGFDVRILGTDLSDRAVAHASYGHYSDLSVGRGLPQAHLNRYMTRQGAQWKVADEIRTMATFKTMNLLEPFLFPNKFDIVLCRNVAIYFCESDRKKLFDRIGGAMAQDGYLIIGSTESLSGLCPQFESQRHVRSVFYRLKK